MPLQFFCGGSDCEVIERWIKVLNELGMRSKQGRNSVDNKYLGALFNKMLCFHIRYTFLVRFFPLDQGCFGLEPKTCLYMELS